MRMRASQEAIDLAELLLREKAIHKETSWTWPGDEYYQIEAVFSPGFGFEITLCKFVVARVYPATYHEPAEPVFRQVWNQPEKIETRKAEEALSFLKKYDLEKEIFDFSY